MFTTSELVWVRIYFSFKSSLRKEEERERKDMGKRRIVGREVGKERTRVTRIIHPLFHVAELANVTSGCRYYCQFYYVIFNRERGCWVRELSDTPLTKKVHAEAG